MAEPWHALTITLKGQSSLSHGYKVLPAWVGMYLLRFILFSDLNISQDSVATPLGCGGIFEKKTLMQIY